MLLGAAGWKACEGFYDRLTLAADGIPDEQEFAARSRLVAKLPKYEIFWKRHVCPATSRPHGTTFRTGVADVVCLMAQTSYSVMVNLLDASDSFTKVQGGDFGPRFRNWRDVLVSAGNALQLMTELQFTACGKNARAPEPGSLAGRLGLTIDPFPDWNANWKAERDLASRYRNYLTHQGLLYTVTDLSAGKTLVLSRAGFAAGARVTWNQAEASYHANPSHWLPLEAVCEEVFGETAAFVDLSYERLIDGLDAQLANPAYQRLWGWASTATPPVTPPFVAPPVGGGSVVTHGSTASKTISSFHKTSISSGPCMP